MGAERVTRSAGPVGGLGALGCRRAMTRAAEGSGEAKMESFEEQSCNSNAAPTSPHPSCNRPLPEAPAGAGPRRFFDEGYWIVCDMDRRVGKPERELRGRPKGNKRQPEGWQGGSS